MTIATETKVYMTRLYNIIYTAAAVVSKVIGNVSKFIQTEIPSSKQILWLRNIMKNRNQKKRFVKP